MNAITERIIENIHEAEKDGLVYLWGRVDSPYDCCYHLNTIAIVRGDYAYVTADLKTFTGGYKAINYAKYVVPPPEEFDMPHLFNIGCIKLESVGDVLSGIEVHNFDENVSNNIPYALYRQVIQMLDILDIDREGWFTCLLCGGDFQDPEEDLFYFESGYHGNGGIGIDVGAPVCQKCYDMHVCHWCGAEVFDERVRKDGEGEVVLTGIDDEGHCLYCAENIPCKCCGEEIYTEDFTEWDEVKAWRDGFCIKCHRGECDHDDKVKPPKADCKGQTYMFGLTYNECNPYWRS